MSVRRPPTREDNERLLEQERLRLRKIGLSFIIGIVVVVVVAFVALRGSQEDSPDVLIVFAGSADVVGDVDEDNFIRVTGQMRRAVDDSRYNDDSTVALFADKVRLSKASDPGKGLTDVNDLRGNSDKLNARVTVVGKIESLSANERVIAISQPD